MIDSHANDHVCSFLHYLSSYYMIRLISVCLSEDSYVITKYAIFIST